MAADSRTTLGSWVQPARMQKMYRLPDGGMAAGTGEHVTAMETIDWLLAGEKGPHPTLGSEATVIRILPDKTIRIYEGTGHFDLDASFAAFGSGMPPALAALHMGASPMEAVRIAALIDPYTGGDIWEMSVEDRNAQPD